VYLILTFKKETKMSKKLIIFVALLLCGVPNIMSLSNYAFAQSVDTAWVRSYSGTADFYSFDEANAIAVDKSGNVYVTGVVENFGTGDDYGTIKYYPNGDTAWVRIYEGPQSYYTVAHAIVVDETGNVYVTGNCGTIKYDADGNQLWARNSDVFGFDIVLDSSGMVYVTGLYGTGTNIDCITIKYYPNGDTVWVRKYNGPGSGEDWFLALAVDDSGNVYVTGYSDNEAHNYDYATIKYYSNGDTAWVRRYNGPGDSLDVAYDLALDRNGNIYVTGRSADIGNYPNFFDYATIKYYPNGDTAWVRRYNGPANESDNASAIAVDFAGNIFVTGSSRGNGTYVDFATIKYYPNGDTAWVRRYKETGFSMESGHSIFVDSSGSVYVNGTSGVGSATLKYYSDGNSAWESEYNNGGQNALTVDGYGNVYVTGKSNDSDYLTIRYVQFLRGDANADKQLRVSDVIYLINYLFKGGPLPNPLASGDANCDGKVSVSDVVYLINYLFKGGPQPCI